MWTKMLLLILFLNIFVSYTEKAYHKLKSDDGNSGITSEFWWIVKYAS